MDPLRDYPKQTEKKLLTRTLELLSPARDATTGKRAILSGADAVYIGAEKFGARALAGNSTQDLQSLIDFAHRYGARVYITLNTILFDDELSEAEALIKVCYQMGADALIIQDMGILEMDLPPIPLFASTQTHNADVDQVLFLEKAGIQRVILARELSLAQIREIRKRTSVELEFFVAGALCVSYSGRCHMSQALCGRSANRGQCAQPCRSHYDVFNHRMERLATNRHALSLKDLYLGDHLGALADAGIGSFKIEGRMKDMGYVQNLTADLHQKLNEVCLHKGFKRASHGLVRLMFEPDPEKTFNRGFGTHFLTGRTSSASTWNTQKSIGKPVGQIVKTEGAAVYLKESFDLKPGDGVCFFDPSGKLQGTRVLRTNGARVELERLVNLPVGTSLFRNSDTAFSRLLANQAPTRTIGVDLVFRELDEEFELVALDEEGNRAVQIIQFPRTPAKNPAEAYLTLRNQLQKSGNPLFEIKDLRVESGPWFFPVSVLNLHRRNLLEELEEVRVSAYRRQESHHQATTHPYPHDSLSFQSNVSNRLARQFYEKHGVRFVEPAFETDPSSPPEVLMTTRYCLRFEMGLCPRQNPEESPEDMYLADKQSTFRLSFDCARCQMIVSSTDSLPPPKRT